MWRLDLIDGGLRGGCRAQISGVDGHHAHGHQKVSDVASSVSRYVVDFWLWSVLNFMLCWYDTSVSCHVAGDGQYLAGLLFMNDLLCRVFHWL